MRKLMMASAVLLIVPMSTALAGGKEGYSTRDLNLNYNAQTQSQKAYGGQGGTGIGYGGQGGAGGAGGAGGSASSSSNASNGDQRTNVDSSNHVGTIPVATAWAAPVMPAEDTCATAQSGGVQGLLLGASVSISSVQEGCELRAKIRTLQGLGPQYQVVAAKMGCFDPQMSQALNAIYPGFCLPAK